MNAILFMQCFWIVNLSLSPPSPCSCLRGPYWHPIAVKPLLTLNSKCFSILNCVSSSAVGWRRPISRLGGAPERHPDVMAPHHRQALPHSAVWMLQPRHPGGSSWSTAEPGCWQLEGKDCAEIPAILRSICRRALKIQKQIVGKTTIKPDSLQYSCYFVLWERKPHLLTIYHRYKHIDATFRLVRWDYTGTISGRGSPPSDLMLKHSRDN